MASTIQVVLLQYYLSDAEFREWGWRVPFLLSIVLLLISLKSRMSMIESPVFNQLRESDSISKTPLRECLRDRRTLGVWRCCSSASRQAGRCCSFPRRSTQRVPEKRGEDRCTARWHAGYAEHAGVVSADHILWLAV